MGAGSIFVCRVKFFRATVFPNRFRKIPSASFAKNGALILEKLYGYFRTRCTQKIAETYRQPFCTLAAISVQSLSLLLWLPWLPPLLSLNPL
jgi:hypothetical protein